jgi:hypothetical protein
MAAGKHIYDESKIKTLSSLEHIRLRTGMYIGRTGTARTTRTASISCSRRSSTTAIDEFIMGHGKRIDIKLEDAHRVRARLRPRHPAGQGRGVRLRDQHRRQVQRRCLPVQRRPERRGHQGGQRAVRDVSRAQPPRGANSSRRVSSGRSWSSRRRASPGGARRHPGRVHARSGDLRRTTPSARSTSSAGCVLCLPERRAADPLQRPDVSFPRAACWT